jgi:hypothetical protein
MVRHQPGVVTPVVRRRRRLARAPSGLPEERLRHQVVPRHPGSGNSGSRWLAGFGNTSSIPMHKEAKLVAGGVSVGHVPLLARDRREGERKASPGACGRRRPRGRRLRRRRRETTGRRADLKVCNCGLVGRLKRGAVQVALCPHRIVGADLCVVVAGRTTSPGQAGHQARYRSAGLLPGVAAAVETKRVSPVITRPRRGTGPGVAGRVGRTLPRRP